MARQVILIIAAVGMCGVCCCMGGDRAEQQGTPPPPATPPASSQPATSAAATQNPQQQATGELAATIAAQVAAQVNTAVSAKGIEYQSELGFGAVIVIVLVIGMHEAGDLIEGWFKYRIEMARVRAGKADR